MAPDGYRELEDLPAAQPKIRFLRSPVATGLSQSGTETRSRTATGLSSDSLDDEQQQDFSGVPDFMRVSCWPKPASNVVPLLADTDANQFYSTKMLVF